jgi:hypothetical protein
VNLQNSADNTDPEVGSLIALPLLSGSSLGFLSRREFPSETVPKVLTESKPETYEQTKRGEEALSKTSCGVNALEAILRPLFGNVSQCLPSRGEDILQPSPVLNRGSAALSRRLGFM